MTIRVPERVCCPDTRGNKHIYGDERADEVRYVGGAKTAWQES